MDRALTITTRGSRRDMTITRATAFVILLALSDCGRCNPTKTSSTSPSASPSTSTGSNAAASPEPEPQLSVPPDAPAFTATLEGRTITFKSAWIVGEMEYGWLFLSTGDATCSTQTEGVTRLEVDLHAGPGDRLFAGHPIAVSVNVDPFLEKKKFGESWIGTPFATLLLDAKTAWKRGDRVRGRLDFDDRVLHGALVDRYTGSGAFDAVICDEHTEWWWHGGPAQVDPAPVAGDYAGEPFTAKSAIAIVMHDDLNDVTYVDTIRLYPIDAFDCARRDAMEKKTPYLQLAGPVPGANDRQRFAKTTQPTSVFYFTPPTTLEGTSISHPISGDAWVRFDAIETTVGGALNGQMFVDAKKTKVSDVAARFAGKFSAKICTW